MASTVAVTRLSCDEDSERVCASTRLPATYIIRPWGRAGNPTESFGTHIIFTLKLQLLLLSLVLISHVLDILYSLTLIITYNTPSWRHLEVLSAWNLSPT